MCWKKCRALNSGPVWLCERGTLFGYHNLVVDPLACPAQAAWCTGDLRCDPCCSNLVHSGVSTGGRGEYVRSLARVGISQGIAAVFIETHPEPSRANAMVLAHFR